MKNYEQYEEVRMKITRQFREKYTNICFLREITYD